MSTLIFNHNKTYCEIILNNSNFGNSFGENEAVLLLAQLDELAKSPCIVLRSSKGKNFCAGGNLRYYANKTADEGRAANKKIYEALDGLYKLKTPKLCIVEGNCFGGGMELVSCFDEIVSAPSSYFGFWQRKIALSFGWGGRSRWEKRLGSDALLRRLVLSAKSFSVYEALNNNLVDKILPRYEFDKFIELWVRKQNSLPQSPVTTILSDSSKERELFDQIWFNDEHKAVLEKYKE